MHPRKEKHNRQRQQQRQTQIARTRHPARALYAGAHQQRAHAKRQRHAEMTVGIHVQPGRIHQRKEARRVVGQPRIQPRLRRVDGKQRADALASQQRGQRRQHERAQKDERVRKAQFPVRPQHDDDRQDEHSLQLKRQRQRKTRRRARGLSFQRKRQPPQRTGRVQAVALGKHATV